MAVTSYKLPTSVVQNGTGVNAWADPNNILLVDGDFAVASGPASEILVGGFNISLGQLDTITNITLKVKGYRGSFNTTLAIYAVDDTSGVEVSYPYSPSFQGFDGTNTLYTLSSSLFGTTWTPDQINNIKLKLVADGTLYLDSVQLAVTYTPGVTPVPVTPSSGQIIVDEFVQGIRFQLAQAMTSSDLFMFAESFTMPDGTNIEYADFYGEALITVDQGILGSEENIRISNVEHDYNGTGLVRISIDSLADRGLGFKYPYESDATRIKAHGGTSEFVISNSAPFYNRFLRKNQIDALVSAPIYFEDEGVALADPVHTVDFQGNGVSVVNDGVDSFKKIVTITGGTGSGHEIQDNGTPMPTEPALNFTDYFTLTDVPGVSTDVAIDVVGLAGDTTFINTLTSNVNFQNAVNTFVSGSGVLQIDQTPDNGTFGLLAGDVDGINDTYTVSLGAYAAGKLQVYLNGLVQLQGASDDYIELVPGSGTFQFNTPPAIGDIITVVYSGSASVVDNYTVKATTDDTTPSFLEDKINIHSSDSSVTVTKTITNPSGNEIIDIDLTSVVPTSYSNQSLIAFGGATWGSGQDKSLSTGLSLLNQLNWNDLGFYKWGAYGAASGVVLFTAEKYCYDYDQGLIFGMTSYNKSSGNYDFKIEVALDSAPGTVIHTWTTTGFASISYPGFQGFGFIVDIQDLKVYLTPQSTYPGTSALGGISIASGDTYVFTLSSSTGGTITGTGTTFTGGAKFPTYNSDGTYYQEQVNSTTKKFICTGNNVKKTYTAISGITASTTINYGDYYGSNFVISGKLYKLAIIAAPGPASFGSTSYTYFLQVVEYPNGNTILNT